MKSGTINLMPGAFISNLRPQEFATDPDLATLKAEQRSVFWYNSTEDKYKYFNGTVIKVMGGDELPQDLLRADGSVAMEDGQDFLLGGVDQSASNERAAISKGHLTTELAKKQDTVTGAATTIVETDLTAEKVLVSDASGKVAVATVTAAELAYLAGATSAIQDQLDGKQATIGYTPLNKGGDSLDGNLNANGHSFTGLAAPVNPTDAARQIDIENAIAGMNWLDDVKAVQADADLDPGTPATGDRYIITDPAALHATFGSIADLGKNDIVEFDGTDFVVVFDADAVGNAQGNTLWCDGTQGFLRLEGTADAQTWKAFGGLSGVNAGVGISKSGNTLNVNLGGGVIADGEGNITSDLEETGGLTLVDAGDGIAANRKLALLLDGATLVKSATGLKVGANAITPTELAAAVAGDGIGGGEGTALFVKAKTGGSVAVTAEGVDVDHTELAKQVLYKTGGEVANITLTDEILADNQATHKLYVDTTVKAVADQLNATQAVYNKTGADDVAAKVHTFVHNQGTRFGNITVFDENGYQIIPNEAICVDENTVRVELTVDAKIAIAFSASKVEAPAPVQP